jgi:hypothetical protein
MVGWGGEGLYALLCARVCVCLYACVPLCVYGWVGGDGLYAMLCAFLTIRMRLGMPLCSVSTCNVCVLACMH